MSKIQDRFLRSVDAIDYSRRILYSERLKRDYKILCK